MDTKLHPEPDFTLLTRGGWVPTAADSMEDVSCPCGCGRQLGAYNGTRPLVCVYTWRLVADEDVSAIMNFGASEEERLAAAKRVLNIAAAIKASREHNPEGGAR